MNIMIFVLIVFCISMLILKSYPFQGISSHARGHCPVVLKLGDDISTDIIYPGRFMATVLPSETPKYAFADFTEFNKRIVDGLISGGSVLLAGKNFGCGSSREQAVSAVHGHGLIVVARGIARIFLQNAINLGLVVVVCPDIDANEGDVLAIQRAVVVNESTGAEYAITPLPEARRAVMEAGGLIAYTRSILMNAERGAES